MSPWRAVYKGRHLGCHRTQAGAVRAYDKYVNKNGAVPVLRRDTTTSASQAKGVGGNAARRRVSVPPVAATAGPAGAGAGAGAVAQPAAPKLPASQITKKMMPNAASAGAGVGRCRFTPGSPQVHRRFTPG